ncbi:GNAT family N-acetyltransferase [Caldalkalibacillus mannanilyticus]|uniref:GNAT family N-acetyltransferase n=1 Tax=Caldalkalibacillus mannanilyticus TaxID=1418 RepID=UPI00046A1C9A|nr:GNAT family N-acetyltransferase [Caldalkalibacillus mannanilyticus]
MEIRRAKAGDENGIARVHVESWRTTYRGIMRDEMLDNLSVERREQYWKNEIDLNKVLYVAVDEKRIVGFASGGKSRSTEYDYDGELYAIYLLEDYQQKGIGRKLISEVAQELRNLGYQSMIVWVLSKNPSKTVYEKLGALAFDSKDIDIAGDWFKEEVLVWKDLNQIIRKER